MEISPRPRSSRQKNRKRAEWPRRRKRSALQECMAQALCVPESAMPGHSTLNSELVGPTAPRRIHPRRIDTAAADRRQHRHRQRRVSARRPRDRDQVASLEKRRFRSQRLACRHGDIAAMDTSAAMTADSWPRRLAGSKSDSDAAVCCVGQQGKSPSWPWFQDGVIVGDDACPDYRARQTAKTAWRGHHNMLTTDTELPERSLSSNKRPHRWHACGLSDAVHAGLSLTNTVSAVP